MSISSCIIQYAFFSTAKGTFSKMDHILGYKANLNTYKKTEIIPCLLSDHSAKKVELNNTKKQQKIVKQLEAEQHATP
jgi:hypothetical protein